MKLYRYILMAAVAAGSLASCSDDKEPQQPDTLKIIAANGDRFPSAGGELKILVNSNVEYSVDVDAEWIVRQQSRAAAVNGVEIFTVDPYPLAADMTPRKGTVTITYPGTEAQIHTIEQVPGDIYRFKVTGMSANRIPSKGGNLTINLSANVAYTATASDPSWITVDPEPAGDPVFAIAENTSTEPRRGSVTFHTTECGDTCVEFTQDPFVAEKGISTADQLMDFAAAVNSGASLESWMNEDEEVVLLADIDMSGRIWVPIGNLKGSTLSNSATTLGSDGHTFTGEFNGNGHTIRNLAMATDDDQCFGLFGVCSSATIRNLVIDSSCTLKVTNEEMTAGSAYGFVAGLLYQSTIDNVTVEGTVQESLMNKLKTNYMGTMGGIAGFCYGSTVSNCRFAGTITKVRSNVYDNSTGSGVGGIVGFARGTTSLPTVIDHCVNAGYIYGQVNRVAGILGSAQNNFKILDCENTGVVHGDVAEATAAGWTSGLRIGGMIGFTSNTKTANIAAMERCTNSGTVVCDADAGTTTGGLIGVVRCMTISDISNSGRVIATAGITGLICGKFQCADKPTIDNCRVGGSIATSYTGSGASITPVNPVTATAANYMQYAAGEVVKPNASIWNETKVTFLQ